MCRVNRRNDKALTEAHAEGRVGKKRCWRQKN